MIPVSEVFVSLIRWHLLSLPLAHAFFLLVFCAFMNVSSYFLEFNLCKFPESWDKDEFLQKLFFLS